MYPYETACDSPMHVPTPCKLGVMGRTSRCDTCWSSARHWREQEICQTSYRRLPCLPARTVWGCAALEGVYDGYATESCAGGYEARSVPTPASLRLRASLILRAAQVRARL